MTDWLERLDDAYCAAVGSVVEWIDDHPYGFGAVVVGLVVLVVL